MQFEQHTYWLPSHWASYLINGDSSSFSLYDDGDDQIETIDQFIEDLGFGDPVDVSDESNFMTYHDARDYGVLAGDCLVYTFLERIEEPDEQHPSLSAQERNPNLR